MAEAASANPTPRRSARRTPRRWRRRLLFVAVALLVGLLLAAVCTEVAFRLFWQLPPQFAMFEQAGLYEETDTGGATFAPGFRGVLKVADYLPTDVTTNSLGMRGAEIGAKRPGETRVLVVGDSLVFGFAAPADDTIPAALGRELAARDRPATVGNGGIPGFGTRDMAEHMAWLDPKFEPDAFVFCSFLGNDALDDFRIDEAVCNGLRFSGHLARLVDESFRFRMAVHSRAWLWAETWIFTNEPSWSPLLQIQPNPDEIAAMAGLPGQYPGYGRAFAGLFLDVRDERRTWQKGAPPVIPRVLANLRGALQHAMRVAGDRPLVFVVLPTIWQYDEARRAEKLENLRFDPAELEVGLAQRRWLSVAEELGIPAVDVTPAVRAVPDPIGLYVDSGGHYNRAGAEIIARRIADVLVPLLE